MSNSALPAPTEPLTDAEDGKISEPWYRWCGLVNSIITGHSGDLERLEDVTYDAGIWTPAFSAGASVFSYSTETNGTYTRVGRMVSVTAHAKLDVTGNSFTTDALTITGLPFDSEVDEFTSEIHWENAGASLIRMRLTLNSGSSPAMEVLGMYSTDSGGGINNTLSAQEALHETDGSKLRFNFVYPTT